MSQTWTVLDEPPCYALGLRTRFRGLSERQGIVWRGAAGWAEGSPFLDYQGAELVAWRRAATGWASWSPFLDYRGAELVPWLRAAEEAAEHGWPAMVRTEIPVNSTI